MARPSTHLQWLLGHGKTAAEKYEILRLNDCLSAQALAREADVISLIEQQMQAIQRELEATRDVIYPPGGGPSGEDVASVVQRAGYLNERGIEFNREIFNTKLPIRLPGGDFKGCGRCGRLVRLDANFCQECGYDFDSCPTCGQRHPRDPTGICPAMRG